MSYGIDFKADIYLSRQSYESKEGLIDAIEHDGYDIESYESQLRMFISANPKDIIPDEWKDEPLSYLYTESGHLLDELKEAIMARHLKQLYLQYLEEGNELRPCQ
jgi:hypothetical protein